MFCPPSCTPSVRVRRGGSILVCFKIMDTSVYFNEIYCVDTQADRFVCRKLLVHLIFDTQGYFVHKQTQKYTSVKMCLSVTLDILFVSATPPTILKLEV